MHQRIPEYHTPKLTVTRGARENFVRVATRAVIIRYAKKYETARVGECGRRDGPDGGGGRVGVGIVERDGGVIRWTRFLLLFHAEKIGCRLVRQKRRERIVCYDWGAGRRRGVEVYQGADVGFVCSRDWVTLVDEGEEE